MAVDFHDCFFISLFLRDSIGSVAMPEVCRSGGGGRDRGADDRIFFLF